MAPQVPLQLGAAMCGAEPLSCYSDADVLPGGIGFQTANVT